MKKISFILSLLFCLPAFAQTTPVVEIDKIIITDTQGSDTANPNAPSSTVELLSTSPQTTTAADVISRVAGVHVQRYGGLEDSTAVSIRGSSQEQVQMYLDGVPLQTASGEGFSLSQIPASTLSSIEIYKGLAPVELGSAAVGGVINLKSTKVKDGVHQRYGVSYGSFETLDALAEVSYGGDKHDVLLGVDFKRTAGDFTFHDDNGTPLNAADDQETARINNASLLVHPHLSWTHRFDALTTLSVYEHVFVSDAGVPGLGTFQSDNAHVFGTEWLSHIALKRTGFFHDKDEVSNSLYWRWIGSQFEDPDGEIGLGAAQDNNNKTFVFGDKLVLNTKFSEIFELKNGVEVITERFTPYDSLAADPQGDVSCRAQLNAFLEASTKIFDKKMQWSVNAASLNAFYNINNNDANQLNAGTYASDRTDNEWTAGTGLSYKILPTWHVKSSVARVVRLPQFMEMFGDQGNVLGNPQLVSESGIKLDAGTTWAKDFEGFWKRLSLETNFFETHMDDLIQFEVTAGRARASNIGQTRVRGVEFVVDTKFASYFELAANYTYQQALDESTYPGNFLIGRPEHEAQIDLSFERKGLSAGTVLQFVDNQYLDALNTQRIDERLIVHANVGYLYKEKYRLGLELKNITNSQIVDALGFPLPGRSFFIRGDLMF